MKMTEMKQYGLNDRFLALAAAYDDSLILARVVSQEKGIYRVVCENGELYAEVSGKLRFETTAPSDFPAVGDFVLIDRLSDENGNAIIHHILSRKSLFLRKAAGKVQEEQVVAANVDIIFICMSLNSDFNLHRLERYLSLTFESGATPVVVLTKADLCENIDQKLCAVRSVAIGTDILVTSAMESDGYQEIAEYLKPGCTASFIGSSGVGKSTLINRLLGEDRLQTNEIRMDDRGRHTTTSRELLLLPNGGIVIDTPGMRELGMWDVSAGFEKSFNDVEALFGKCKFRNCTHTSEPGCAVYEAIANGELSLERWDSYRKLKAEAAFADDHSSYLAEKEKKFKNIAKINKANKKG